MVRGQWKIVPVPIPGLNAVTGLAMRGIGSGLSVGMQLISLPTRVIGIVERTEDLLTRVEVVTRRIEHVSVDVESIAARANGIVLEIRSVVEGARNIVAASAATVAAIDPILARTGETIEHAAQFTKLAEGLSDRAGDLVGDGERMLGQVRPLVERAVPQVRRFVEQLTDQEVDAAIAMVDELPELAHSLKTDIVPILATLDGLAPNVEELVKLTDDVRQAILGIPGFGRLRRRGAEKLEEEEQEEAAEKAKAAKRAVVTKVEDPNEPMLF